MLVQRAMGSILYGEVAGRYDEFSDKSYLTAPVSLLFMSIWPIPKQRQWTWKEEYQPRHPFAQVKRSNPVGGSTCTNDLTKRPRLCSFAKNSRFAFMSCYLYMIMLLRGEATSSFIINWLVEQLLDDAARTEASFIDGTCNRNVWFWTMIFGLSAVRTSRSSNLLERSQISHWHEALCSKIRLANGVMDICDWTSAKMSLRQVAWTEGFDGEAELRRAWEDSTSPPDGN